MRASKGTLRLVVGACAVAVTLTMTTLAAVYVAGTESTAQVAQAAAVYGGAESLLAGAAATQSRLSETLTASAVLPPGAVDDTRLAAAEAAHDETANRADTLERELDAADLAATDRYLAASATVISLLAKEEMPSDPALAALETAYRHLVGEVVAVRQEAAAEVAAARSQAGTLTTAARTFVALVLPLLVVYAAHRSLRSRQRRRELEMQIKLSSEFRNDRDHLIASVGHELRTPLTGILGLTESLRQGRRAFSAGERNRMIETIADESQELAHRVDNLVVVGRIGSDLLTNKPRPVDVRAAVRKVTYGWETRARSRLTLTGAGIALADPHHLEHVLRNLLTNAALHGGPEIEVRIHRGSLVVAIEVRDNGTGLPEIEPSRRRISTEASLPAGLGLGLTAARQLTEHMGGTLEYRRHEGVTVFTVKVPAAAAGDHPDETEIDLVLDPYLHRPSRTDIEAAIDGRKMTVVYEPIVSLDPAARLAVRGYEALARFPFAGPTSWFREATAIGVGVDLELAAIREAVASFDPPSAEAFLSVNVSDEALVSYGLREALGDIDPRRVVLELSEEAAITSYEATGQAVRALQDEGYRLALDDVGQGETDLWHILRMRPAIVKLDVTLVRDLPTSPELQAMVRGIVACAESLGAAVIGEGVETPDAADHLLAMGVLLAQGHMYGAGARGLDGEWTAPADAATDRATWLEAIEVIPTEVKRS